MTYLTEEHGTAVIDLNALDMNLDIIFENRSKN
ncbi:hypothetical protein MYMA111404_02690 [Mycoplasma marinum]